MAAWPDRIAPTLDLIRETMEEVGVYGDEKELGGRKEFARRAVLLAAADLIWRRKLGRLLSRAELQEMLGQKTRQAVSELVRNGRVLALPSEGAGYLFPAFQVDATKRRIYAAIPRVLAVFEGAVETPLTIAAWFVEPDPVLDREVPADWLREHRDDARLVIAAQRRAAELRH